MQRQQGSVNCNGNDRKSHRAQGKQGHQTPLPHVLSTHQNFRTLKPLYSDTLSQTKVKNFQLDKKGICMSYTPHTSPRDGIRTMQLMVFSPLVCGIARTLFYPMDVLRDAVTSPRADAAQRLRIRMRSGGALALWRGNSVRLPRFILLRSLTFCSFDVLRRRLDASLSAMSPTANTVVPIRIGKVMVPFVAAGLGATVASLAQYPMDHVQALNSARPKGGKFQSVGQGLRHIVHRLGLKGLWKWFPR